MTKNLEKIHYHWTPFVLKEFSVIQNSLNWCFHMKNTNISNMKRKKYQWDSSKSASPFPCMSHTGCSVSEHKSEKKDQKQFKEWLECNIKRKPNLIWERELTKKKKVLTLKWKMYGIWIHPPFLLKSTPWLISLKKFLGKK